MLKKIPSTDLHANPHITSRITIWKKFHGSLQTMLNGNPGIGFNPTIGLLECHDECWARIIKCDPDLGEHAVNPTPTPPDEAPVDMDVACETPAVDNSVAPKIAGKKRGVSNSSMADRLCDVLVKFCKSSNDRIGSLIRVIGDDADICNSRKDLFNVLGDINDLTEDERIDAAHFFCQEC
ncbi:hypothetical protein ACS0TY_034181 [Phlomoides rotata]